MRSMPTRRLAIRTLGRLTILAAILAAGDVRAEDTSVAAATVLFDEGVKLMDAGRHAEACPKLERSQALAPSGGTLLALGECYEKTGKVASAWIAFRDAAARAANAGKRDAEAFALDHAARLEPKLPRLTIVTPSGSAIPGLEVQRGGVVLKPAELGVSVPLDPGAYEIRASAPKRRTWSETISLEQGKRAEVVVPVLAAEEDGIRERALQKDEPPPSAESSPSSAQRTLGLVVAGVGLASLVTGGVFGLMASSTNDDALSHCTKSDVTRCDSRGLALTDDAKSQALLSTIFVAAGGAALVGGGVLFFTAPSSRSASTGRPAPTVRLAPAWNSRWAGAMASVQW